jgi:hypothetical protein
MAAIDIKQRCGSGHLQLGSFATGWRLLSITVRPRLILLISLPVERLSRFEYNIDHTTPGFNALFDPITA